MAIITISRGSYSFGKLVAEKVAKELGYSCLSREILVETSAKNHVKEAELFKAIHDSPSFFENKKNREKYIAMIKATLLEHAISDNLIYHGNAGHFLIPNIGCLLRVRLVANLEERISLLKKIKNIDENEAKRQIEKEDKERISWTQTLYKVDLNSPELYDIIIHIDKIDADQAAKIICDIARDPKFVMTAQCKKKLIDEYVLTKATIELFDEDIEYIKVSDCIITLKLSGIKMKKTSPISPELEKNIEQSILDDMKIDIYNRLKEIPYVKDIIFV